MSMQDLWKYYCETIGENTVECTLCKNKLPYSGSVMSQLLLAVHFDNHHPMDVGVKRKHTEEEPESRKTAKSSPTPSTSAKAANPLITPSTSEATSSNTPTTEQQSSGTEKEKIQGQAITNAIANLMVDDLLPFSFVESEGFRKFVEVAVPDYTELSRAAIESRINSLYDLKKAEIQRSLQDARHVSLTVDVWKGEAKERFMTVTCHFVDEDWKMKNHTLYTVPMKVPNSVNFRKKMERLVGEYKIISDKIVATIHNGATYIANTFNNYNELGNSVTCFAHTIQLCLNDGLAQNYQQLNSTVKKCSSLVDYIKYSNKASQAFLAYQIEFNLKKNKLVQIVPKRWNSTYLMLDRIREQRRAIESVLNDREITSFESSRKYKLTEDEWKLINQLTAVLEPFQTAVNVISEEQYPMASIIVPFVALFINNYLNSDATRYDNVNGNQTSPAGNENELEDIAAFQKILKSEFIERFALYFNKTLNPSEDMLFFATFLDPRYKTSVQNDPNLLEMIKKQVTSTEPDVQNRNDAGKPNYDTLFQSPTSDQRDELKAYLMEKEILKVENPLLWWKNNSSKYPALSKLAKKYLCIPATSVPPERIFSSVGDTTVVKRSFLSFSKAEKLMFLHHNK